MYLKDKITLASKRIYKDQGFLAVPARIARSGTYEYTAGELGLADVDPSKIIIVYRPESEVFSDESLQSFANTPVTNNHPEGLLTPATAKEHVVGQSGDKIMRDGMFAEAMLHINDAQAIVEIEGGKIELSNGYTADIRMEAGKTSDGEHYDAIQSNIRGNHIAIVTNGRAGSSCRFADDINQPHRNPMKIIIDGVEYEVSDQTGQAVAKLQGQLTDAKAKLQDSDTVSATKMADSQKLLDTANAKLEETQTQLDEAKSKTSVEAMDKAIASRSALIATATKVAPTVKLDGLTDKAIIKAVVADKRPKLDLTDKSEDYIQAAFDTMVVDGESSDPLDQHFENVAHGDASKDTRPEHIIARDKMVERNKNAWKPKTEGDA